MNTIIYKHTLPDRGEYFSLFETTGWNSNFTASENELHNALVSSWATVAAYEGSRLVGFGRVLSDGVLYGMIYDLIVSPAHQGRGIGSEILARLVAQCRKAGLRCIGLFAADGKAGFYEKHGFTSRPATAPGMVYRAE